jgi:hypothetical protein
VTTLVVAAAPELPDPELLVELVELPPEDPLTPELVEPLLVAA